jgi:cholesterol transport system auxiliary component
MSAHRQLARNAIAATVLLLPLIGCGGLLPKREPLQIISPQTHVDPDPAWPQVGWQLVVARPTANDMLDSRRIAVIPSPGRIEVYKGAAWDDDVPDIVQDAVVHAFEDSGKILAVGHQSNGLRADFMLQLDLRDDQAVYRTPAGPPEVVMTVSARLIDSSSSRVVASRTFRQNVAASGTGVPAVARAFDGALVALAHDLVGWTFESGQKARLAAGNEASKH